MVGAIMRCASVAQTSLLLLGLAMTTPTAAQSEPPAAASSSGEPTAPAPSDEAGRLYDEGLADMLAGRFDSGCPKLAESYRLEPMPGALFTVAECEAGWGKSLDAIRHYRQYLGEFDRMTPEQQTGQKGRDKVAKEKLEELSANVGTVTFRLPDAAPAGTVVKVDGREVAADKLGQPEAMEPGEYRVTVEAPGHLPREHRLVLTRGEKQDMSLGLGSEGDDGGETGAGSDIPLSTWGWVAGGVGAAALIVGIATGAATMGKKGIIEDHCAGIECDPEGLDAADSAQTLGAVSTFGFVLGGIGLAAGITILAIAYTSDSSEASTGEQPTDESTGLGSWVPLVAWQPGPSGGLLLGTQAKW